MKPWQSRPAITLCTLPIQYTCAKFASNQLALLSLSPLSYEIYARTPHLFFHWADAELLYEYTHLPDTLIIYESSALQLTRETFEICLPPCEVVRFPEHWEAVDRMIAPNIAAISDVDRWVNSKKGSCGPWANPIWKHGFVYNFNGEIMAATNDMCFAHGLASHGLGLAVVESRQLLNPLLALNGHESIAIFCNLVNPFVFWRCQFFMIANCGSVSCNQLSMLCLSMSRRMTWMTMAENNGSLFRCTCNVLFIYIYIYLYQKILCPSFLDDCPVFCVISDHVQAASCPHMLREA